MPHSTKRRLFMIMATSLFVTAALLAYSSENENQRRSSTQPSHPLVWHFQQPDSKNNNQSLVDTRNNTSLNLADGIVYADPVGVVAQSNGSLKLITQTKGQELGNPQRRETASQRVAERRDRVKFQCSEGGQAPQSPSIQDVLYNAKHKFYYCPVEKVASTFWRRFIYQLHHTDPVKSPFDVPIMTALRGMRDFHLPSNSRSGTGLQQVLKESTKLLFVRDPHSRIFSAYVDKLLAPNPYYWKVWALPAIVRYRANHQHARRRSHCGHDVTFEEFVKYVIATASKNDGHVMPINRMCTPCAVTYTVIGKMETFGDDIDLLFDYLHLDKSPLRMDTMKQETTQDAIADSATDALSGSWLASSLRCISKEAVLQRIWRKSQIRGFVSWRKNMKLSPSEIQYMNSHNFIKLLNEASRSSSDKNELKIQKMQAMKEAFASLNKDLLATVVSVYGNDLKLFGYSESPSWLESARSMDFIDTKAFDYTKTWDLSKIINSAS